MNKERNKILCIDPSFTTMGVGFINLETREIYALETGDIFKIIKHINANCKMSNIYVVIENPNLNKNVFKMWYMVERQILDMCKSMFTNAVLRGFPTDFVSKALNFVGLKLKKGESEKTKVLTTIDDVRSKFAIAMNYAQKVGENKAAAKFMIKMFNSKGVPIIEIAPSERRRSDKIITKAIEAEEKRRKSKLSEKEIQSIIDNIDWSTVPMPTKMKSGPFEKLTGFSGRSSEHSRDSITMAYNRGLSWIKRRLANDYVRTPASYPKSTNESEFIVKRPDSSEKDNYLN